MALSSAAVSRTYRHASQGRKSGKALRGMKKRVQAPAFDRCRTPAPWEPSAKAIQLLYPFCRWQSGSRGPGAHAPHPHRPDAAARSSQPTVGDTCANGQLRDTPGCVLGLPPPPPGTPGGGAASPCHPAPLSRHLPAAGGGGRGHCRGTRPPLSAALQPGSSALELYALPPRADTTGRRERAPRTGHSGSYQHVIINY